MKTEEYLNIIYDIVNNEKFRSLKNEVHHHNSNRFDHNLFVSYYTYKICKKAKLDYVSATRAALVHDFFFNDQFSNKKDQLLNHSKKALVNSSLITSLSHKESNIILSHMYPVGGKLPKCRESIVVDLVDDYISIKEKLQGDYRRIVVSLNFLVVIMVNYLLK